MCLPNFLKPNLKKWPIRRQMIISFIVTTILLQVVIFIIIFINLNILRIQTTNNISNVVSDRINSNLKIVAYERGDSILSFSNNIADYGKKIYYQTDYIFKSTSSSSPYPFTPKESNTYQQVIDKKISITENPYFTPPKVSYATSSVHYSSEAAVKDPIIKIFVEKTALLDYYMNYFINTHFKLIVVRTILAFETNGNYVMRVYPASKINDNYNLLDKTSEKWFTNSLANPNQTKIYGPYKDQKGTTLNLISIPLVLNIAISGKVHQVVINLETNIALLNQYFSQLEFLRNEYLCVVKDDGTMVFSPTFWKFKPSQTNELPKITDASEFSGISATEFKAMTNTKSREMILDTKVISSLQKSENFKMHIFFYYLIPKAEIDKNLSKWEFAMIIYVKNSDLIEEKEKVKGYIDKQNNIIVFVTLYSCVLTLIIVIYFSYKVAMDISRPLKKLIKIASLINNNSSEKNIVGVINDELPKGEYQIAELIDAFKNLLGCFDSRSKGSESGSVMIRNEVNYPQNDLNPEFLERTKGVSDIPWRDDIEKLKDEEEDEDDEEDEEEKDYL